MKLIVLPQLLLIAGTCRNTGKTTLACNIIRKFSPQRSIIAIKITPHFHQNIQSGKVLINKRDLFITEETDSSTGKDSSLMLEAGARQSFFVMVTDEHLCKAIPEILRMIPSGHLVVCESGGLRDQIVPGLFFFMDKTNAGMIKPSTEKLKSLADPRITSDGENIDYDLDNIEITDNRWTLKMRQYDTI